jgi:hypothetical protein
MDQRGVMDRGMLDEVWRRLLRRIVEDVRLGGYEPVCRPIIDELIAAWSELMPYLHLPAETAHPFVKPEGEVVVEGYLARMLALMERIRESVQLFPGTAFRERRENILGYLDRRESAVREDVSIMRQNFRKTQNPRATMPGSQFVMMKVRTEDFQRLRDTYQILMSSVIGSEAYDFFREQYMMVEQELATTSIMCKAEPGAQVH